MPTLSVPFATLNMRYGLAVTGHHNKVNLSEHLTL